MRASQYLISTKKEIPGDAEIISHQLMLRAGMIKKLGSGLYSWLPLGLKVMRRIETIVREEMNRSHALEILMPAVQPAELWHETGRWETFGGQLLKMKDNNQREYCFGPTHEEVITDIMRQEMHSYKQLPVNLYQIQTKFRDEIRPRFGVMRAREFTMKDAYSFHLSPECLSNTYQVMYATYCRIFDRMGLKYRAVEADTGAIGGAMSHEFQVLAKAGEDILFYSDASDYAANIEQAKSITPSPAKSHANQTMERVATPGQSTIEEVANYLKIEASSLVKTLIVEGRLHTKEKPAYVALVLRGDDNLNEIKASKHPLVSSPVRFASDEAILETLNVLPGSIGPVNLPLPIIVDHEALAMESFVCGANEPNLHLKHVSWGRDVASSLAFDLRNVKEGDQSPDGKGVLKMCRGIEVGHIFQLGDKYSKAMGATITNEQGQRQVMSMGCYGLGISRIVAAAIEQNNDPKGIVWPDAIAPFQLVIIPINANRASAVKEQAEAIYQRCLSLGIDVLMDDRNERPGVLFADCDLIGIPHRLVVSERHLQDGLLEYKRRDQMEPQTIALQSLETLFQRIVR